MDILAQPTFLMLVYRTAFSLMSSTMLLLCDSSRNLRCQNQLENYRPISNLNIIFKVLERVVFKQRNQHILDNNLGNPCQSAYKANHSTETALLKIKKFIFTLILLIRRQGNSSDSTGPLICIRYHFPHSPN